MWFRLAIRTSAVVATAMVGMALANPYSDTPSTTTVAVAQPVAQTQDTAPEGGAEQWWTTTDCPAGVEAPCLDPTVDPALIPDAGWRAMAENLREYGPCEAQGKVTASDYSCVGEQFYAPRSAPVAAELGVCAYGTRVDGASVTCMAPGEYDALPVQEDSPSWSCQTMGNRVCGPGGAAPAGCYSGGALVIPWSNYADPKSDPLYGQLTAPC